jgi:hypothetical protein
MRTIAVAMARPKPRPDQRWWRDYCGLAGVNDNTFGGLLNGSYPNDWFERGRNTWRETVQSKMIGRDAIKNYP